MRDLVHIGLVMAEFAVMGLGVLLFNNAPLRVAAAGGIVFAGIFSPILAAELKT